MSQSKIQHLAFIMDGNNRWGTLHNKNYIESYNAGAIVIKKLLPYIATLSIKFTSFFVLSTENFARPQKIIKSIVDILNYYINHDSNFLFEHDFKIIFIGNLQILDSQTLKNISHISNLNQNASKVVIFAINYGGQNEILDACNKALELDKTNINKSELQNLMYYPQMPQVDLLIRTGGEFRLSNFLLWHMSYSELYFTKTLWPDFTCEDLSIAISEFNQRVRKFGK
ncbi:MAG: di-trans,poly-cis-decaprenylcistransferase [Rickettsia sp.]|nr:di-trans,poly-cis-decaprenylcistransferase [Rickettsia sp.]